MNKYEAARLLPKVGARRVEVPTIYKTSSTVTIVDKPQECVVIEVNRAHLWYRVQFKNGFRECYKVPQYKPQPGGAPQ